MRAESCGMPLRSFPHRAFTPGTLICARYSGGRCGGPPSLDHFGRSGVDIVFILVIAGLYAVSHGVASAISRLTGEP